MKIENPLKMNDWEIKKFLYFILLIQIVVLIVIILDNLGLNIPIIRELIPFFYLIFVPGIIILRILRLHKLGNILTLLFAIGLSLSFLMFIGLFMNIIYPFFGILKPISPTPLIITISFSVLILSLLSYIMDKNFSESSLIDLNSFLNPKILLLCLFPFLAIFGTYLMNFYHINIILLIMILLISFTVLLIGFDKFFTKKLYPLIIFVISITLVYQYSLISTYVSGYDIMVELYYAHQVINNSLWNFTLPNNTNAMLSIVILAPILSKLCAVNLVWIFKIAYPFFVSLIPLGLYKIFKKQTNSKIAFLSVFLFMSFSVFYTELLWLAKQEIAEFFLVLMLILIIYNTKKKGETFLFILFGISLIISHYGTSYLYLYMFIFAYIILFLYNNQWLKRMINRFRHSNSTEYRNEPSRINLIFILSFFTFSALWYIFVTSSSIFNTVSHIFYHIIDNLVTNFLHADSSQGLHEVTTQTTHGFLGKINTAINLLNQLFIIIGIFSVLFNWASNRDYNFKREYLILSLINVSLLLVSIGVPFFADELNISRIYHLTLLLLAPFYVIGALTLFMLIKRKILRMNWTKKNVKASLSIISVFIVIYFMYQSGFVYQITQGSSGTISLDSNANYAVFNNQEVLGAEWFSKYKLDSSLFYSDYNAAPLLVSISGQDPVYTDSPGQMIITNNSYVYLRKFNIENKQALIGYKDKAVRKDYNMNIDNLITNKSLIYSNGNSQIYYN